MLGKQQRFWMFIALTCSALFVNTAAAQSQDAIDCYNKANAAFEIGRFEEVDSLLAGETVESLGEYKVRAYRLLALSSINQNNPAEAEKYVNKLLAVNPYYKPEGDSPRFEDMIEDLRRGKSATITTASKQAESVEEAPVPVTLITEEMIKASGARTLQEALEAYVPGVLRVEGPESNISMRGMYGYFQETMLIMINGVRMNSYITNSQAPDYRISLANAKQIEVLRGPASSLYGNVALTAVVNIITKSGSDLNGTSITLGGGTHNTYKATATFGKSFAETDVVIWGSIYNSKGYKHTIAADDPVDHYGLFPTDGSMYIDGYNRLPTMDFGLVYKWKDINIQLTHQYGKRSIAYTNLLYVSNYDYDRYEPMNGIKPGKGTHSTNLNIKYNKTWGSWDFEGNALCNYENVFWYNTLGDSLTGFEQLHTALGLGQTDEYVKELPFTQGGFLNLSWQNITASIDLKAMYNYKLKRLGEGNILFGAHLDNFNLFHTEMSIGDAYNRIALTQVNDRVNILKRNSEACFSGFFQLKHKFNHNWLINMGLRYDYKNRYTHDAISVLSPRLAAIWLPDKDKSIKLAFGRSFVDAPYFYRASKIVFAGNEDLRPEYLESAQLNATLKFPDIHLTWEGNLYYNSVRDVVGMGTTSYANQGRINTMGLENTLTYAIKGFKLNTSMHGYVALSGDTIMVNGASLYNAPNFSIHLQASKEMWVKNLWLTVSPSFYTNSVYKFQNRQAIQNFVSMQGQTTTMPAHFLLDANLRYSWRWLEASVNCYNILGYKYRLGGDRVPILQPGRTFMASVTFNL